MQVKECTICGRLFWTDLDDICLPCEIELELNREPEKIETIWGEVPVGGEG